MFSDLSRSVTRLLQSATANQSTRVRVGLGVIASLAVVLAWQLGPTIIQAARLVAIGPQCRQAFTTQTDLTLEPDVSLSRCVSRLQSLAITIDRSAMLRPVAVMAGSYYLQLPTETISHLLTQAPSDLGIIQRELLTGDRRYAVLLQNSDELRATGGFAGSLATLELHHGQAVGITVYDIFAPAGQFTGYREPPPGVKEYLSGGETWRLQDANWSPDFPMSAQTVLSFLGESGWPAIDGVVGVNLIFIEKVLAIVGPVWLPDYHQLVTAENLAELARSDRASFFPGSYQKAQFLQSLSTHLRLKLSTLTTDQYRRLLKLFLTGRLAKDWQVYSHQPELETVWQNWGLAGAWGPLVQDDDVMPFAWIESNVGINKANRRIGRTIQLEKNLQSLQVSATITNTNSPSNRPLVSEDMPNQPSATVAAQSRTGHYVNYQRVWVPATTEVTSLLLNQVPQSQWHELVLTTTNGYQVKEIGWVMTVSEDSQATVELNLKLSEPAAHSARLWLWKQPGTAPTTYSVTSPPHSQRFELVTDQFVNW